MNEEQTKPFLEKEIKAFWSMHPNKVLGPDGMYLVFFKKIWHIIGKVMVATI